MGVSTSHGLSFRLLTLGCLDGFQLLHAVHAVEQFLENLRSRRCNFHIAWFKDHRDLCYNDRVDGDVVYKYQLTRKILIKHFALNPSATSVEFPSMNSPEWSGYLGANAVHFILCSDGLRYNDKKRAIRYQEILCRMSLRGYSVATIDDVEFKSSKVRIPKAGTVGVSPLTRDSGVCVCHQSSQEANRPRCHGIRP